MTQAAVRPDGASVDLAALQRRTLNSLRLAQVPGQAAVAGMVAVVSLLAGDLLGSDRLAGMASASFTLGAALTAIPLAAHSRRHGRRIGLAQALIVGALGSAVAAFGGQWRIFPLFIAGMLLFGAGHAATLQQRYVAADLAPPDGQARAIAAIVWIGTLGAIFGPLLTPFEKSVAADLGLDELVGPFLFATVLFVVAAIGHLGAPAPRPVGGDRRHRPHRRPRQANAPGPRLGGDHRRLARGETRPRRHGRVASGDGRRDDDDPSAHEGPRPRQPLGVRDRRPHPRHVRPVADRRPLRRPGRSRRARSRSVP